MDMQGKLLTYGVAAAVVAFSVGLGALTRWWVALIALVVIVVAILSWIYSLGLGSR